MAPLVPPRFADKKNLEISLEEGRVVGFSSDQDFVQMSSSSSSWVRMRESAFLSSSVEKAALSLARPPQSNNIPFR